jgi:galactitol-specific phosphotransferase system IIB component
MPKIKSTIHVQLDKSTDYKVKYSDTKYNEIVIETPEVDLVISVERLISIVFAADLAKVESLRNLQDLTLLKQTLAECISERCPAELILSVISVPGLGGRKGGFFGG